MAVKLPWLENGLDRVSQPISIKYKMVHGLNQAVFRTEIFKMFPILDFSSFSYVLQQISDVTLSEKNWIISLTANRNKQCL